MLNRFFFYGTLMQNRGRHHALEMSGATRVGPAQVRGLLYSVSDAFPALLPGKGVVLGELWEAPVELVPQVLQRTDAIEGYRGHDERGLRDSMYLREKVKTLDGVKVWTYVWNHSMHGLTPIKSGSWATHEQEMPALFGGTAA